MGSRRRDKNTKQAVLLPEKKYPRRRVRGDRDSSACKSRFDARNTESYQLGVSVGYEEVSGWLFGLSNDRFYAGDVTEALILRRLAEDVAEQSKAKRQKLEERREGQEIVG